jgi:hypothetical protein
LDNPKFILIDEGDFFRKGEQEDVRHVSERYIAKSDPYIVMVSTPNAPDGLFERIEKEAEDTCIYKRLFMDYTYGYGTPSLPPCAKLYLTGSCHDALVPKIISPISESALMAPGPTPKIEINCS